MTPTSVALLGFAGWTILMVLLLGVTRTGLVFAGKKKSNEFKATGEDLGSFGYRATRVHANCYENLPAAAAVMLYAIATSQTAITDPFALAFIGLRVAQSSVHLLSTAPLMVSIRFALYIAQNAILIYWILALVHLL
ncbi:MAG: MAPEG family protein [Parvularculaceae bacterium]|nr:MAPEG family protein [Parvularculaceae bacterium]